VTFYRACWRRPATQTGTAPLLPWGVAAVAWELNLDGINLLDTSWLRSTTIDDLMLLQILVWSRRLLPLIRCRRPASTLLSTASPMLGCPGSDSWPQRLAGTAQTSGDEGRCSLGTRSDEIGGERSGRPTRAMLPPSKAFL
jgi:hypothetical protein